MRTREEKFRDGVATWGLPRVFVLREPHAGMEPGTTVYRNTEFDTGLASEDTRLLDEPCISISLRPDGKPPYVTAPLRLLTPAGETP